METKPDPKYKTDSGVDKKFADMSGEGHALKEEFGDDEKAKSIEVDASIIAPNIAELYDDPAAGIREYLSNAETACIRRARAVVDEAGRDIPNDVSKILEAAKEEGYDPLIEVEYNRKPEATRLVIDDNGIGISTDEYLVLKNLGYSTSHDEGTQLGQFGMGYMSGFQLSGVHGLFKMYTRSYNTEKAFSTANHIANFEYLDGLRETYGTRFEFPSFCEKAQRIDVPKKVSEYAEGMRVPVLYRDYDDEGKETSRSDDFIPSNLEDRYDGFYVKVENEFFEAVMAPQIHRSGGTVTYNISMPIRRNNSHSVRNSAWNYDFRGKTERGEIVACDDESLIGLTPVSDGSYDGADDQIPESEVPESAIRSPEPASSRDSYEAGNDEFWRHVERTLNDEWKEMATESVETLDSLDDLNDVAMEAIEYFGTTYSGVSKFQDSIENHLGVSIDEDLCEEILESQKYVNVVKEGHSRPHTKSACNSTKVSEILDNDVYIGQSISKVKARIVWELGGVVVRCDTSEYDELQELWGWKLLKDVKTSNLGEHYPSLDDDFVEKWDQLDKDDSPKNTTPTTGRSAEYKSVRVRSGRGSDNLTTYNGKDIKKTLEDDDTLNAGRFDERSKLIIFRQKKGRTVSDIVGYAGQDTAVAKVPKYVYDYLEGTKNVYTSVDDLRKEQSKDSYIMLSDGYTARLDALDSDDVLVCLDNTWNDHFEGRDDDLLELINEECGYDATRLTHVDEDVFDNTHLLQIDANIVSNSRMSVPHYVKTLSVSIADLIFEEHFGDVDLTDPVMEQIFTRTYSDPRNDPDLLQEMADFFEDVDLRKS